MNSYLQEVFSQTADEGYFDFARCQRDDGTIYASPTDTCRKGTKIDADDVPAKGKKAVGDKKMRISKKIKAMSVDDLKKVASDPRLSDQQKQTLTRLIKAKEEEAPKPTTAAAKNARPVDPKVAKKVDKALAKKAEDPFTPEQRAAQDALLAKMKAEGKVKEGPTAEEKRKKYREDLRKAQKEDAPKAEKQYEWIGANAEGIADLKKQYSTMQQLYKVGPPFNGPENRARMINMRLEIYKRERSLREKLAGPPPESAKKAIAEAPKYEKTPGSSKPIPKATDVDVKALEKQKERLSKEFDKIHSKISPSDEERARLLEVSNELLDVGKRINDANVGREPRNHSLRKIYEQQGFNAKPELVATASDLRNRKDVLTGSDGQPVIIYRGVTTQEFSDQFKGLGPDGDKHYPGRGIFGNGTYGAAASDLNPRGTQTEAIKTAKAYAGENANLRTKVTAFALRKDANIATFPGKEQVDRERAYDAWYDRTIEEAQKKTGYKYSDIGEAAAALGYAGYQAPQRGEDFYVILNRGAIIAAMDSQID
jgi:hypothetical protein